MNELSQTTYITVKQHIAFTQMDQDIVLMGPENGRFYGINCMGAEIWNLIMSEPCTIKTICEYILQNYEINEEQCLSDVNEFLQNMQKEHFISLTEG